MSERTAAVVGAGGRGRDHVLAYERVDGARPVACAARTDPRRDDLAEEFGLAAYDDAAAMLADTDPDVVHVATPPQVRVSVLEAVSRAGVPACTVEKPVAVGVSDWRALRDLAERSETKFAVCHQFRWHPHLARCREAIRSGDLGEVEFVECSARLVVTDQGTHCLHYGNALNGDARVREVFGNVGGEYRDGGDRTHPGPDATEAVVTFENGVRAAWTTGGAGTRVAGADREYQHVRCVAHAEAGRVEWEEFGDWAVVSGGRSEGGDFGGEETWRENNRRAQAAFHRAMFDWLDGSDPPGTHLERSLHEWKAVLALYESALANEPVRLDEFDPDERLVDRVAAAL
ncbi:MAG: Gfo/Idh/MocA family protein [Halobacteriaceae archaeon]